MGVATDILRKGRGAAFDSDVVDACLDVVGAPDFSFT